MDTNLFTPISKHTVSITCAVTTANVALTTESVANTCRIKNADTTYMAFVEFGASDSVAATVPSGSTKGSMPIGPGETVGISIILTSATSRPFARAGRRLFTSVRATVADVDSVATVAPGQRGWRIIESDGSTCRESRRSRFLDSATAWKLAEQINSEREKDDGNAES
jgi:hypothetical protein